MLNQLALGEEQGRLRQGSSLGVQASGNVGCSPSEMGSQGLEP